MKTLFKISSIVIALIGILVFVNYAVIILDIWEQEIFFGNNLESVQGKLSATSGVTVVWAILTFFIICAIHDLWVKSCK